jgi:hypothetical protein
VLAPNESAALVDLVLDLANACCSDQALHAWVEEWRREPGMLEWWGRLRRLDLSSNALTDHGVHTLCTAMPAPPQLLSLHLSDNSLRLGVTLERALNLWLAATPHLQSLELEAKDWHGGGLELLCVRLSKLPELLTVALPVALRGSEVQRLGNNRRRRVQRSRQLLLLTAWPPPLLEQVLTQLLDRFHGRPLYRAAEQRQPVTRNGESSARSMVHRLEGSRCSKPRKT